MSTIRFELRKNQVSSKTGKAPIRIIYSLNGNRTFIPTKIRLNPLNWNEDDRLPKYVKRAGLLENYQVKEVLDSMKDLETSIRTIEKQYEVNGKPYSGADIALLISADREKLTKKDESKNHLFEFMDKYIEDHKTLREPGSLSVYKSVKTHLEAFEKETRVKVRFDSIDYAFFSKFQAFLISRTKTDMHGNVKPMLNNTTIAKALSTLKTFLSYARRNGIEVSDNYRNFTIRKEKLEVIALDQEEFDSLLSIDLSNNKRLDQTRDIFCFSCSTGLRYSDIAQLRREHINDGFINIVVKKTKSELTVPLNSISGKILQKYSDRNQPLPVISNQRLNDYIKELCQLAGIDTPQEIVRFRGTKREVNVYPKYELVHFHTGRKTFCTLSLEKGMSAEEVMEISGHSDYKSFKRYVKVTEKRKKVVMQKAWGEVQNLKAV
ncbi:site-specific integrase [Daejeonella sp. H1SJ63]|uniref:site-specific integrase n=1 Tax=Daejeonella sp. H1SJ63 TaxID=3034145 RepID=UPI0023EB7515|nr:site-specific integrase [Daejeonella sp. H1SJ63]